VQAGTDGRLPVGNVGTRPGRLKPVDVTAASHPG